MNYTYQDYLKEEQQAHEKMFPKIKYKKQVTARKQHFCDECGCEIHKNEKMWWYKPRPTYNKLTKKKTYYTWRTRCEDHEPISYEELNRIKSLEDKYGN